MAQSHDKQRRILAEGSWVGHYGCGRLVKCVSFDAEEKVYTGWYKPKSKLEVDCPACGRNHRVAIWWRRPKADENVASAELEL
jgi:hypothetical protein